MTDDKDRKILSDEEMEDVAGGEGDNLRGSVTVNFIKSKKDDDLSISHPDIGQETESGELRRARRLSRG